MANLVLRPNAIGYYNAGWNVLPAAPRWQNIDDADHDGDASYVYTSTPLDAFTVELTNLDLTNFPRPHRIPGVTLVATVRTTLANPTTFRFRLRYLGVDYDSEDFTISSTSYIEQNRTYITLPDGNAWNTVKLNKLQIGLVYISGEPLRCTKMELHVHTELYPHWTTIPDAEGFHTGWTATPGGADKFRHLTPPFDGNLSYLSSTAALDAYTAGVGDIGPALFPGDIDRVRASALVRNDDATLPATVKVRIRSGGADYDGATTTDGLVVEPGGPWEPISETWVTEPSSGFPSGLPAASDWLLGDVNAMEIGLVNVDAGPEVRMTSMEADVWLKYLPATTMTAVPVADGFHTDLPPLVPGAGEARWEDVDDNPPDDAASYVGGNADTAGTALYATFDTDADTFVVPAGEQILNVQVRLRLRLGTTSEAVIAPLIRWTGETYMGLPVRIEGTGATWFDVKEDFFTHPVTGTKWTTGTLDAEYGMVILSGEVYLSAVLVEIQTAPDVTGASGGSSFLLTDAADTFIARAAGGDGTVYAVLEFGVGNSGYDPLDPKTIVPVVKADVALINEIARFPITKVTTDYTSTPKHVYYWCRVPAGAAIDRIGEVGLFAQILDSPFPAEIGTWFLFGILHMPVQCRHQDAVHLYVLRVDYP